MGISSLPSPSFFLLLGVYLTCCIPSVQKLANRKHSVNICEMNT